MARVGQVTSGGGSRLVDCVGLGVLAAQFPDDVVEAVVDECGRREQRVRDLPSVLMVRYVMALALFPSLGYEEVMRQVKVAGDWLGDGGVGEVKVPATTAVSKARDRLGVEPLRVLFERTAVPLALGGTAPAVGFYRQWRVCAVDGTTLAVPDSDQNAAEFGKPGNDKGAGALPQVRVLGLVECGTRALLGARLGATVGTKAASEQALTRDLLQCFTPGMVVLADRNFLGFNLWKKAQATGADLVWRAKKDRRLPVTEAYEDGSYLSHLVQPGTKGRGEKIVVRVVEYTLDAPTTPETYRLVTTITDPTQAPAHELAELYAHRWEAETLLDEIKTHQQDKRVVLRSRTPERVKQELWAILLLHRALRTLIYHAASHHHHDPGRLSFTHTVTIIRRQVTRQAVFPP